MNLTEVFDSVGGFLLLPNTELATTKQVTEFFRLEVDSIRKVFNRNNAELELQGTKSMGYKEIEHEVSNF